MKSLVFSVLTFAVGTVCAQHAPYTGHEQREIKALSAEEISQYRAGAGMGYALPAELNHFPGPMHVLELADRLALSEAQREATRRLMETHKAQARSIGARLVEAERALDQLFAKGGVDATALAESVRAAAALQGEYRLSHLETHRQMRALLDEEQVRRYDALRGYASGKPVHSHRH